MNLNNLDLNKVRTFLAVHQGRSMQAAAQRLHVTPSAISMAISTLERSIGLPLFVRVGRRILPTANGDRLASVAGHLIGQLEAAISDLRSARGKVRGHLRLGVPAELGVNAVIPSVGHFRRQHPDVSFTIRLGDQDVLIQGLIMGQYDRAICDDGSHPPEVASTPLASEEIVLACSRRVYDKLIDRDHSLDRLRELDHIAYVEHQADLKKWYRHHFNKSVRLNTPVIANHAKAVFAAIQADLGLGLLPAPLVGNLRIIDTGKSPLVNVMSAVRLNDHVPTRAEQAFLAFLTRRLALPASRESATKNSPPCF
jgi:DNA-binding transcriptional LysR family regulator